MVALNKNAVLLPLLAASTEAAAFSTNMTNNSTGGGSGWNMTNSTSGLNTTNPAGIDLSDRKYYCNNYPKVFGKSKEQIASVVFNQTLRRSTVEKLSNAVKIPTVVEDYYPNPATNSSFTGWQVFNDFHEQLERDFPLCWKNLKVEVINSYSLILTWEGSDESMKPAMFNAHQDVVPVDEENLGEWKYPPFSGYFDGEYVWGRGSFDDKNMLIGILQAAEYMLENEPDFKPKRTLLFTFGADEEISGFYGATYIADTLEKRYGKNGIYSITDEGGNALSNFTGNWIASPATSEKGLLNLEVAVAGPGGHSSSPPDHTTIGYASQMIAEIESEEFQPYYTNKNPMTEFLNCQVENSHIIPTAVKAQFLNAFKSTVARTSAFNWLNALANNLFDYYFKTAQSVTVINGGVKTNALPEITTFTVSARIALESNVNETMKKFVDQIWYVSNKNLLSLYVNDELILDYRNVSAISVNVTSNTKLEPAPVSPPNDVWNEYAGVIKGYWEDVIFPVVFKKNNTECLVAGSIPTGNTDSKRYWNLTENIYRYQPGFANLDLVAAIHSVNERVDLNTLMFTVGFFYDYFHAVQN